MRLSTGYLCSVVGNGTADPLGEKTFFKQPGCRVPLHGAKQLGLACVATGLVSMPCMPCSSIMLA